MKPNGKKQSVRPPVNVGPQHRPLMVEQIRDALMARIKADWSPGERLRPVEQLARELGVGVSNTLRAVQTLATEGYLVSRPGRGTFVADAAPQRPVSPPRANKPRPRTVTYLTSTQTSHVHDRITWAVSAALERLGYRVNTIVDVDHETLPPKHQRSGTDAWVVLDNPQACHQLAQNGRLFVSIRTDKPSVNRLPDRSDEVALDMFRAGTFVVTFCVNQKDNQLVALRARHHDTPAAQLRQSAWLRGLRAAMRDSHGVCHTVDAVADNELAGAACVQKWIQIPGRPAVIAAASDALAIGFLQGAAALGLTAGHEFQIIGLGATPRGMALPGGPLTTVDLGLQAMGDQAAQLLTARLDLPDRLPRRVLFEGQMFGGRTTHQPTS